MKPFILLLVVFALSATVAKITHGDWNLVFSGNLAMCLMLCFTAIGHFKFMQGMTMMIPPPIPFKRQLVIVTGLAEVVLGICLLFAELRCTAAWVLIIMLVLMLPANIYAARKRVDYEKGTFTGSGLNYLWFRVPLQLLFIGWLYFFSIR